LHWIQKQPLIVRLTHYKTLRHLAGIGLGAALTLTGSAMAIHGHEQTIVPHVAWDAIAYTIHGFGALPIIGNFEVLWKIVMGGD